MHEVLGITSPQTALSLLALLFALLSEVHRQLSTYVWPYDASNNND